MIQWVWLRVRDLWDHTANVGLRMLAEGRHRGGFSMNRYLMMTVATLLGGTAQAFAGEPSRAQTIRFVSYCDGMSFYKSPDVGAIYFGTHILTECGESDMQVVGGANKKSVGLVEGFGNQTGASYLYEISRPIRNGGTWELWVCEGGASCFEGNSGTYDVGPPGQSGTRVATTAKLADIIAKRKAAQP
jgi:hypothetical protein